MKTISEILKPKKEIINQVCHCGLDMEVEEQFDGSSFMVCPDPECGNYEPAISIDYSLEAEML